MNNFSTYQIGIIKLAKAIMVGYINNVSINNQTKIVCLKSIYAKYRNTDVYGNSNLSNKIEHKLNIIKTAIDYLENSINSLMCFENAIMCALEFDSFEILDNTYNTSELMLLIESEELV